MTEKVKLIKFIEKYNLGGRSEAVLWKVENGILTTDFTADDKSIIGTVELKEIELQDCELGVFTTSELTKMLSALSSKIEIEVKTVADKCRNLKLNDEDIKMSYVLSDPGIIPAAAKLKKSPECEIDIDVTPEFTEKFLKAKSAISEAANIAFQSMGNKIILTVGYSQDNTNRSVFEAKGKVTGDIGPCIYNSESLKAILVANKDCNKGVMSISERGLMKLEFDTEDYHSVYYIVEQQKVD